MKEDSAPNGTSAGFRYSTARVHIVRPWHGYEYDLETGALPTNGKIRLRTFEVTVRDGDVYVALQAMASAPLSRSAREVLRGSSQA